MAFYEDFMEKEQYLLYPNGYSGTYKKYIFDYDNVYLIEEYFHNNGKIEGIKIIYDRVGNIERMENYISGQFNGIMKIYNENILCETRNYFNNNYFK